MRSNPYFRMLSTSHPPLEIYTSEAKVDYTMLKLVLPSHAVKRFTLGPQEYQIDENNLHFSIFDLYDIEKPVTSPIHLTIPLKPMKPEKGKPPLKAHVFYDDGGNILSIHMCEDNKGKKPVKISGAEETVILRFAEDFATEKLNELSENLEKKQDELKGIAKKQLDDLEYESRQGTRSETYEAKLEQVIQLLQEHEQFYFYPETSVKECLQKYFSILKKDKLASMPETKEEPDLAQELALLGQRDELNTRAIIQACIEGNLTVLKTHFNEKSFESMDRSILWALLPTCVYHNYPELFDYIFYLTNDRRFRYSFCPVYVSETDQARSEAASCLEIAFDRRNISFFNELLKKYKYNPNQIPHSYINLLTRTIDERQHEYAAALLEAGANPNIRVQDNLQHIFLSDVLKEDRKKMNAVQGLSTPLHYAVSQRDRKGVELLLKYGARSNLQDNQGFTAFGLAVSTRSPEEDVDPDIISLVMSSGDHDIDEKQGNGATGLYLACQKGQPGLVNLLLEFKADPSLEHVTQVERGVTSTPLICALLKKHSEIVKRLLQCDIPLEKLKYAYDAFEKPPIELAQKLAVVAHRKKQYDLAEEIYKRLLLMPEIEKDKHMECKVLFNLCLCLQADQKIDNETRMRMLHLYLHKAHILQQSPEFTKIIGLSESIAKAEGMLAKLLKPSKAPVKIHTP